MTHKLLKSTLSIIIATVLIRLLGFAREVSLAYVYGAGVVTDAFIISLAIPSVALAFISSSVSTVYIPLHQRIDGDKSRFTSNILTILIILGIVFALIFTFFPQALVFVFASQLDPATFELASSMTRIMVWAAAPILTAGIYTAYLQMKSQFFLAAIFGAITNCAIIASIFLSSAVNMWMLLAIGALIGNMLYMLALTITCHRRGLIYHPYLDLKDSALREMIMLIAPVFFTVILSEINQVIDRNFASSLPIGTLSSLNYANKMSGMLSALTGTAIATVLFPQMSKLAANGEIESMKRYISVSVNKLIPIILPAVAGGMILAPPMVRILFERGAFSSADTYRTAQCLQMYMICFATNSINPLFTRAFHSMQNSKTPAKISIASIATNITLNFILIGPLQHRGLTLATAIASLVSTALLIITLRRKIGGLGLLSNKPEILKMLFSVIIMSIAVAAAYRVLPVMSGGYMQCLLFTAAIAIFGALLYLAMHIILRTEYYHDGKRQLLSFLRPYFHKC